MAKRFNYTGTCIPGKHYMVNTSRELEEIIALIDREEYFTINRPRQFGKSTSIFLLARELGKRDFLVIQSSFEALGEFAFSGETAFSAAFLALIRKQCVRLKMDDVLTILEEHPPGNFIDLDNFITDLTERLGKKVVLMIDEVDAATNNDLFLKFLALLRSKFLARNEGRDSSFHSVILAGVHDVKTIKRKIKPGDQQQYNSPWNIAVDFTVDMSFRAAEIETMLVDYAEDKKVSMDIPAIAKRLRYFTAGYPFLVSKLCYIIDAFIMTDDAAWQLEYVDRAVDRILRESNTNFESLIKNLENNPGLYQLVEKVLLKDINLPFNEDNNLIKLGTTYGIFSWDNTKPLHIHNLIYKERLYNYMALNLRIEKLTDKNIENYNPPNRFIKPDQTPDFEQVLTKFQQFMKEQYSSKDDKFVERNWRLLYLAFLKPIINGHGFDFKEVQISEEKRLDVVITYENKKYINELKIWDGPEKHERGTRQLTDYLERQGVDKGYLVIFDFRKKMKWESHRITSAGKEIFMVWV